MGLKRLRDMVNVHTNRIRNEIVPVSKLVDLLAISRVDIVPAQRRIYRTRAHLMDNLSQRLRRVSPSPKRRYRRNTWIIESINQSIFKLFHHLRLAKLEPDHLQPSILDRLRIRPTHVLVEESLSHRVSQMLLSPNDVSNSHQMIIDRRGEIVQRPDTILGPNPRMWILLRINHSESWPIPNSRIRMSRLRLDPNHRLSLFQLSIEHLVP